MATVENVISTFSADHVTRITGLTSRQLAYWEKVGFFKPTFTKAGAGSKPIKVYTFQDVLGLRVIAVLLDEHKVSLQKLRRTAAELADHDSAPWSNLALTVCKGEVTIIDRRAARGVSLPSGQYVLVPIIDQIRYVRRAIADLSKRQSSQIGMTETHRNVAHNMRVFAGTRIPVRTIEKFLEAGYNVDAILREYPSLERRDVEIAAEERRTKQAA